MCNPWGSGARGAQWRILIFACWMFVSPALMPAQSYDREGEGDGEVAFYGGGAFGLGGCPCSRRRQLGSYVFAIRYWRNRGRLFTLRR